MRRLLDRLCSLRCALVAWVSVLVAASAQAADIDYTLQFARCDDTPCLHVTLTFVAASDEPTRLRLPTDYAGSTGAATRLRGIRATNGHGANLLQPKDETAIRRQAEGAEVELQAKRGERIHVSYHLLSGTAEETSVSLSEVYLPAISSVRARLLGWTSLAIPLVPARLAPTASLRFLAANGLPVTTRTNLGAAGPSVDFPWHPTALGASIVLMGDFAAIGETKINASDATTQPVLVVQNELSGRDFRQAADDLSRIEATSRRFWGTPAESPPRLVFFGELADRRSSLQGAAFGSAFMTFATSDRTRDGLNYLWMHELQHGWLPHKMVRLNGRRGADLQWFTEGFTEYVTHALMEEAGLRPAGHLNQELAAATERLAAVQSPEPYAALVARFHRDPSTQRPIYDRGFVLASRWDREIRCRSGGQKGLRDVLRGLLVAADQRAVLEQPVVERQFANAGVARPGDDVERFVARGEAMGVTATTSQSCD